LAAGQVYVIARLGAIEAQPATQAADPIYPYDMMGNTMSTDASRIDQLRQVAEEARDAARTAAETAERARTEARRAAEASERAASEARYRNF
jgi:hypothetical protein